MPPTKHTPYITSIIFILINTIYIAILLSHLTTSEPSYNNTNNSYIYNVTEDGNITTMSALVSLQDDYALEYSSNHDGYVWQTGNYK